MKKIRATEGQVRSLAYLTVAAYAGGFVYFVFAYGPLGFVLGMLLAMCGVIICVNDLILLPWFVRNLNRWLDARKQRGS